MLVLVVKLDGDILEQCVIIKPNLIVTGQDLKNIMLCPSSIADVETNSHDINYLLMQEKNDYFIQAVHIIKMCSCLSHLLTDESDCVHMSTETPLISCFLNELIQSETYRRIFYTNFLHYCRSKKVQSAVKCNTTYETDKTLHVKIVIHVQWPRTIQIDYSWNKKIERLEMEKLELENWMAWLSTLGGAYSALGEEFEYCAETAGKISHQQLQLAMKLGDPIISSKCKVYFAISLIQQGYLQEPMRIIKQQYKFATSLHDNVKDNRLINMCKGVWAKMKYMYSLRKKSPSYVSN